MLGSGCKDSAEEQAARAAQFTTATKPAPNPQRESLESLIRKDLHIPTGLPGAPKYELYSNYAGEDIRQVTGVSGRKLILLFTADWCEHSKKMREALKELAEQEKGNIQVVDVNADEYAKIAEEFQLTKVPTIFIYTEGFRLRTFEGYQSSAALKAMLNELFGNSN